MLVEDEAILAMAKIRDLEKAGYDVIHVSSGEKAIETVASSASGIDLILMDIDLGSGMDGTETVVPRAPRFAAA